MKKILFLLSFCIISLGIQSEEKKVITDADILHVNSIFAFEPVEIDNFIFTDDPYSLLILPNTAFDPFVSVSNAREKAEKNTKCTATATSSEITIRYVKAAVQNCDFYQHNGAPKRPDMTECKHGHHKVTLVIDLNDGSKYTGRADYDCTYGGYQVARTSKKRGKTKSGQTVEHWADQSDADPFAPWYVEHIATQHIDLSQFAKSGGISTNELVKRILYYGIRSVTANGQEYGGASIHKALFYGAGYKAKWDAIIKTETNAGMADWNAAKNEMKKTKPDFEKVSQHFISGSKHFKKVRKFDYGKVDEINKLFRNFTNPMYEMKAYDTLYMGKVVQAYLKTMEGLETTTNFDIHKELENDTIRNSDDGYNELDKETISLITKLWYEMRDYNPGYFETYNRIYTMPDDKAKTIANSLKHQRDLFKQNMKNYAIADSEAFNRTIANYLNNQLTGDSCMIDTLIIAKANGERIRAKRQLQEGNFDILYMFKNAPDTAMWNRSQTMHNGYIRRALFNEYYMILNKSVLQVFDTLCTMIIDGNAEKASKICHNQLDPILGAYKGEKLYRYDLFHYYYNSYNRAKNYAQLIEDAADRKSKATAKYIKNNMDIPKGRNMIEDFNMGHVVNRKIVTEDERNEVRKRITNVQKQVDLCKEVANFEWKNDFLVVADMGDMVMENFEFGVGMKDQFVPIKEVYIDGKLVKIKPKKHNKSWQQKQWLYKYKGSLQPIDNNSFHCFIFKGKDGMSGFGKEPFLFDRYKMPSIYWLEYPSSAVGNSENPVDEICEQRYLKLVIH